MSKHGTRTRYVKGCRCRRCCVANREYQRVWQTAWRRRQGVREFQPAQHGGYTMYVTYGCRCDPCRAAYLEAIHRFYDGRKERLRKDPSVAPHGTLGTYDNYGCRCSACKRVKSNYNKSNYNAGRAKPRRVSA